MVMSHEGVTLVTRTALVLVLISAGAIFRTLVGPGRRRGRVMAVGTVGGMASGVLAATPISQWLQTDASAVCACGGMVLGWCVAWRFARRMPREAD